MKVYVFELYPPSQETIDLIAGPYLQRIQFSDEDRKHINDDKTYLLDWFNRLGITQNDIIALYTDPNHTTTIKGEDGTCYAFIDAVEEYTKKECPIVRVNPKDMSDSVPSQIAPRQKLHPEQFVTYLKIQEYVAHAREQMLLKLFYDASQKKVTKFSDGENTSNGNSPTLHFDAVNTTHEPRSTNGGPVLRSVNDDKHQSKFPWVTTFAIALSLVAIVAVAYNRRIWTVENDMDRFRQERAFEVHRNQILKAENLALEKRNRDVKGQIAALFEKIQILKATTEISPHVGGIENENAVDSSHG